MKWRAPRRSWALILDLIVLILIWHISATMLGRSYLPVPLDVFVAFLAEWKSAALLHHSVASLKRILLGIGYGVLTAFPLAVLTAEFKILDRFISPLMDFLYPIPKVVFLPIIVFIFGLGDPSIIFLIAFIMFFQIFIIVKDAIRDIPPTLIEALNVLGAQGWHRIRYVFIPAATGATVTAIKVSIGTAIAVLFIAESIGNNVGLGYYIVVDQWNRFAYKKVYAGVLTISLIGTILFGLLAQLEHRLNRWKKSS